MKPAHILFALAVSFVLSGIVEAFVPERQLTGVALWHGLIIGVICYLWCKADAAARGAVPPGRSALLAGIFPLIGVPVYFFRTRSRRAALADTGKSLLFFVAVAVLGAVCTEAVLALRT